MVILPNGIFHSFLNIWIWRFTKWSEQVIEYNLEQHQIQNVEIGFDSTRNGVVKMELRHGAKSHISANENTAILWWGLTRWDWLKPPWQNYSTMLSNCNTGWNISHLNLVEWWRVNDVNQRSVLVHIYVPSLNIKSPFVWCINIPESGALVHHDSNWKHLWAAPENPRTAPSPGLTGIRVLHLSSICISSSDFPCDGFSRSKPAGAPRLCTCASISKAIRAEIKHLWIFWIMLPKLHERGNWGHFELTVISVAYLRRQTRVFGVNRKG